MKKLVTLSAFALFATLGVHQSAMANCYCPQGMLSQGLCYAPQGQNNSMRPIGYAVCPAQPARSSRYDTPPPRVTDDICQARPQGGKSCLQVYKSDPNYKFNLTETNRQGTIVYFRAYHIDGDTVKSEQWYNENGLKHGAFKSYHPNGNTKSIGNYVNNLLQGEFKIHDENGQLIKIEHYQDDVDVLDVFYQNGKKHGQETEYGYTQTKRGLVQYIARTAQWVNGVKHGEEKFFEVTNNRGKTRLVKTVIWQNGKTVSHS